MSTDKLQLIFDFFYLSDFLQIIQLSLAQWNIFIWSL